ncbi:MAG: DUF4465 domain-containing protein [Bacteroidetes bacterium]|nr:DUF4465 domain-containing protein [Bacteroidota bacterium]MBS1741222.1 DUF4465 domain-containing protein [Bacteroidota bacterium]
MRKTLLFLVALIVAFQMQAQQIVATFDTLYLSKTDTFYLNKSASMVDLGFNDGYMHFPYYYDTSYGGFWSKGFAYSNMKDSVTSGFGNMYSAKAGSGYGGSAQYVVCEPGYGATPKIDISRYVSLKPFGFYVTNSTYAYNAMRSGYFGARKFGDTTGTHSGLPQGSYPDWFLLTITGYANGQAKDTVQYYLADYRFANNAQDYIIRDWQWVSLSKFTLVDSIGFSLSSSDNDPMYGMNTPGFFCIDNFTCLTIMGVPKTNNITAKIYPIPATDVIHISCQEWQSTTVSLLDMSGRILGQFEAMHDVLTIPVADLPSGTYVLQFNRDNAKQSVQFIKQ